MEVQCWCKAPARVMGIKGRPEQYWMCANGHFSEYVKPQPLPNPLIGIAPIKTSDG